jgi:hypothetical protein
VYIDAAEDGMSQSVFDFHPELVLLHLQSVVTQ